MTAAAPLLLAEFRDPAALLDAARRARRAGLRELDAHTPFPVEGLPEALALPEPSLRLPMLLAGLLAAALVFAMCWYSAVVDYPLNLGGRPLNSWQVFLVLAFEAGILCATLAGVLGFFWRAGLPRLHHPVFAAPGFERASQDRFFLSVADPEADAARLMALLEGIDVLSVQPVPR
jgi:hypothetical protein